MTIKQRDTSSIDDFPLNKALVLECFDAWTYTKGEGYFRAHAVVSWESKENRVLGKVEGSWSPYYKTELRIKNNRLIGSCSCPVGSDCKHCVALALQWLEDKNNQTKKGRTPNAQQLKLVEEESLLEGELEPPREFNDVLKIPLELKRNPIQDISVYLKSLTRSDLENLTNFFMKAFTKNQKIIVFTPEFILITWRSHLTQLDDDFNEFKTKHGVNEVQSPLKILEQIKDESNGAQCVQAWFEGYADLMNQIKTECQLRGIFEADGEELYEYYKSEEYDRAKAEIEENASERYEESYRKWDYDYDDYLEPYEDFDLDTGTLKSYIEDFFKWILDPVQDVCEYILLLHQHNLESHVKFLITEGIQWLKDLMLPTEELGVDPKNISALQDLKSVIDIKLSFLTTFSSETDQLDFLFDLFAQNSSQQNSEVILSQLHRLNPTEKNTKYFIKKILEDFERVPKWEKFVLLKRLIDKHASVSIMSFLRASIDSLSRNPDAGLVLKEVYGILEGQPVDCTIEMESSLLESSLKVPQKNYGGSMSLYRETVDWLVSYYFQKEMSERAFNRLIELVTKRPKAFEFRHYKLLKKLLPSLTDQKVPEFESAISIILQKGDKDVAFRLLITLGKFDNACERIKNLSTSTYSYFNHNTTQWGAITQLIPHISSIADKNKESMIKILKAQITNWLSHSSRNRPDASIAEAISQIRTIIIAFKTQNGEALWQKWFKTFSNKHWRLRNLRTALATRGIEMKKT